jgi:hypothetical protein
MKHEIRPQIITLSQFTVSVKHPLPPKKQGGFSSYITSTYMIPMVQF